jgi:hypothetical protein
MTEAAERISEDADTMAAHILADLHELRGALAEMMIVLSVVDQRTADLAPLVSDLAPLIPAARRAAAILDSPVTSYLTRKEGAPDGRPADAARTGRGRGRRRRDGTPGMG